MAIPNQDSLREAKEQFPDHDFPCFIEVGASRLEYAAYSNKLEWRKLYKSHSYQVQQITNRINEYDDCNARLDAIRRRFPARTPFDKIFLDLCKYVLLLAY